MIRKREERGGHENGRVGKVAERDNNRRRDRERREKLNMNEGKGKV